MDNSAGVSFEAMLLAIAALNLISEPASDDAGGSREAEADELDGVIPGVVVGGAISEENPVALAPNREKT